MAPVVPLDAATIARFAPTQTLLDLVADPTDFENDLHVLLHWLQPCYPTTQWTDPLARTRAAARKCLKDDLAQREFVRLYLALASLLFHTHFRPVAANDTLQAVAEHALAVREYYTRQLAVLGLARAARDRFFAGLDALFVRYLLLARLVAELDLYLHETLFAQSLPLVKTLAAVGLGPTIQNIVVDITVDKIRTYVHSSCAGVWAVPVLQRIHEWVRVDLYPGFAQGCTEPVLSLSNELVRIALDELVLLRQNEIFRLVAAYPKSTVALGELHSCLVFDNGTHHAQTQQRARLVNEFLAECTQKLLHLGTNTVEVVIAYIKTIKAFLLIDPTGVLLDKVARPIRRHLKTRGDLVHQLVGGMLNPDPTTNPLVELSDKLHENKVAAAAPIDDLSDVNWVPDPIDALPDFKKGKVSDVVEALVSIFPLLSVLIEEFTRLFGERLLQCNSQSAQETMRYVELLKTRFGANEFATLDVMINDVQSSAELNASAPDSQFALTVLSKMYWPTVCDSVSDNDTFAIPCLDKFDHYGSHFRKMRKGRELKLIPSLGSVTVELEIDGNLKEFNVTPTQATAIELFNDEEDALSVAMVTLVTRMSEYVATQALNFWVKQGVLSVADGKYKVVETSLH